MDDVIELKDITVKYEDSPTPIFDNLNLKIIDKPQQGQFISILGPSGSGKSTILRLISGLQKPTLGQVLLYGQPRKETDMVGMVFQQYSSLPWLTVLENVALPLQFNGVPTKERNEKAMDMLHLVGLQEHAYKYAQYPLLSGGQLQRVAIARSLLANPKILLMDEPFGALDIKTRLKMQDLLLNIWLKLSEKDSSTTIIFVTHDISEAVYLSDEIHIIKSKIQKSFTIDIPFTQRTLKIKRDRVFTNYVAEIEDYMSGLE